MGILDIVLDAADAVLTGDVKDFHKLFKHIKKKYYEDSRCNRKTLRKGCR